MNWFLKSLIFAGILFSSAWIYSDDLPQGWKVAFQSKYPEDKRVYAAGFLNDTSGIMAGYGGLIMYTSDGGKNWTTGVNNSFCRWGVDILDEKTAYTCGNKGHNRISRDGGSTWSLLSDFGGHEPDNGKFISFSGRDNGWVATRHSLASTKDGGASWVEIDLPKESKAVYSICLLKADAGFIMDKMGQLFSTKDGGQSWNKIPLDLKDYKIIPFEFNNSVAAVNFTDENNGRVILFMIKPERQWLSFRTSDGGASWTEEALPVNTFGTLYLSHDGKTLSITDTIDKIITVLHPL